MLLLAAGLLLAVVGLLIRLPLGLGAVGISRTDPSTALSAGMAILGLSVVINMALAIGYEVYFLTSRGATLGKMALGLKVAGLFSNNDSFCKELTAACRKTGERVWRLPLHDDFKEQLKSSVADLKNIGGKWGGAVTAAKFLEQFVGSTPWIHLDIAGPSWCDTENSTRDAGGTGCFVRSLVAYLERWAEAQRGDSPHASG